MRLFNRLKFAAFTLACLFALAPIEGHAGIAGVATADGMSDRGTRFGAESVVVPASRFGGGAETQRSGR